MELIKDYIIDMPVAMFPVSKFEQGRVLMFDGQNKSYKKGDLIEMNTLAYNYKKSCIIIDLKKKNEGLFFGVLIQNGVVIDYKAIEKEDLANVYAIYLPTGEELKIDYYEEFKEYLDSEKELFKIINDLKEKYNNLMIEMQEKSEVDETYFIFNKYKLDDCLNEIKDTYIYFDEKWHEKTKEEITMFGLYLSCLVSEMLSNLSKIDSLNEISKKPLENKIKDFISDGEKRLGIIKDEFSNYIYNFKNLNFEYLKWLDLENTIKEEALKNTIENIIENIHYHLES